jgi:hypothetical protein
MGEKINVATFAKLVVPYGIKFLGESLKASVAFETGRVVRFRVGL